MDLSGQRVVVIGGTSGIGFAVAEAAAQDGAQVTVVSSSRAKVDAAVKRLPKGAAGAAANVADEASVAALFERVGGLDHLVFTAGDWSPNLAGGLIEDFDFSHKDAVFGVRFWGAVAAIKHARKRLSPSGSIVLTDGLVAHRPRVGAALLSAMCGAIEHLTRALAVELAPIRVNAVCPGYVLTERLLAMPEAERTEFLRVGTARFPLKRAGEPAEIAQAYISLMRGGYTTGQVLHVDGGATVV